MRITNIDIPKSVDNADGLEDIDMKKLGHVVLIAGKNGSGKTRILRKIFGELRVKPKEKEVNDWKKQLFECTERLEKGEQEILRLRELLANNETLKYHDNYRNDIRGIEENTIKIHHKKIEALERNLSWRLIETDKLTDSYSFVHFVPKQSNLQDCSSLSKNQIINNAHLNLDECK